MSTTKDGGYYHMLADLAGEFNIEYKHAQNMQVIQFRTQRRCEPRCEKTGLQGFRADPTQTGLYSQSEDGQRLEISDLVEGL